MKATALPHAPAHDPYCPVCAPDEETATQLCDAHFEARWAFAPAEVDATSRLADRIFGHIVAPVQVAA